MYLIQNFKSNKIIPDKLKEDIDLFKFYLSEELSFAFYENISLKIFLENKTGKSFLSFEIKKSNYICFDKMKKNINIQDYFNEFQLNRTEILNNIFSELLTDIEKEYQRLLTYKQYKTTSCIFILKKAVSASILTRNVINFNLVFNFLKENFSFINGIFIKKDINSFSSPKKCLLRVNYSFELTNFLYVKNKILEKNKSSYMIFILNFFEQKYLNYYKRHKQYYIFKAIKNIFNNDISILKLLYFIVTNDLFSFEKNKNLKIEKEYITDNVIAFNTLFFQKTTLHPFSLIEGLDYKRYSPEEIDFALFLFISFYETLRISEHYQYLSKKSFLNIFDFINYFGINHCLLLKEQNILFSVFNNFLKFNILLNKEQLVEYKEPILFLTKPFKKEIHFIKSNTEEYKFLNYINNCFGSIHLLINRKDFLLLLLIYQNDPRTFYSLEKFDSKSLKYFASLKD